MRIAVLLSRHPSGGPSPIFADMLAALRGHGHEVDAVYPDDELFDIADVGPRYDLYVLKCRSEMGLTLGAALHAQGARILNPYPVSALCRDKVATTRTLQAAGIPVPQTWATARRAGLAPLLADGPLIVKPNTGSKGRGVVVVRDLSALAALSDDDGPAVVQRYLPPDGLDRKLYCIGREVYGVLRTWPARTPEEKLGRPFEVEPALREIVLASAAALGLEVFGLDVVVSGGCPAVVDLSAFPGFKGVPRAAERMAEHLAKLAVP
ncbi:MAG: ATP-grasp domain-containing protein [Sporichthyaceae bacterium]